MTSFEQYMHGEHAGHPATDTYLASPSVAAAVNASLAINRALLLAGEPGCGKTALAYSIAEQLGLELLRFDTHSESRFQDVLYTFDAVGRLREATQGAEPADEDDEAAKKPGIKKFRRNGPLGKAIESKERCVVLIDEVDKAPRDFCNGLLPVLEGRFDFAIPETRERLVLANPAPPIIVFTTNEERVLPDAFLRRCVFCHVDFPDAKRLENIVRRHLGAGEDASASLARHAAERLVALRAEHGSALEKKPGTAELLDWVRVLVRSGMAVEDGFTANPHLGVLLKTKQDLELVLGSNVP